MKAKKTTRKKKINLEVGTSVDVADSTAGVGDSMIGVGEDLGVEGAIGVDAADSMTGVDVGAEVVEVVSTGVVVVGSIGEVAVVSIGEAAEAEIAVAVEVAVTATPGVEIGGDSIKEVLTTEKVLREVIMLKTRKLHLIK